MDSRGLDVVVVSAEAGYEISKTSDETTSRSVDSDGMPHRTPGFLSVSKNAASSSRSHIGDPPLLKKVLPSRTDVTAPTKRPEKANLPVDVLLLTAEECGFLACYNELKHPYRCYFVGLGYVYFSNVGDGQQEVKVALLSCYKNDSGPGGSLISVKNAATVLKPKAVIYVGSCKGLVSGKSKLGDVVVSAKLATFDQEQATSMKVYVSKHFLNLIKNCADGWQAPLENLAEAQQVQVYTDAEFLTGPEQVCAEWGCDQLAKTYLREIAIETGGQGVFTAAFDCEIEWLIVKGIADYADGAQVASESWSSFASAMAASLVAHILSDPVVFQSWHHYEDLTAKRQSESMAKKQIQELEQVKSGIENLNEKLETLQTTVPKDEDLEQMKSGIKNLSEQLKVLKTTVPKDEEKNKDDSEEIKSGIENLSQKLDTLWTPLLNVEDPLTKRQPSASDNKELRETFHSLTVKETVLSNASTEEPLMPFVFPEKLVEVIRRDYKGAVLCPFPWCEDELQLKLSSIFTRLQINSRKKERSKLTDDTVNMTDVFKSHPECDNPRVVLIEGNPGMGKTTYCQKLAYDWSVGEIPSDASFPEVKMLLLLKCRDIHMETASIGEAIDDQLLPQDAGKKEKEDFFHFIRSNQSRILLVLDGLDELRDDLVQGFLPLIQGKVFANVYLILTSRHEAGMKVRRYCDTLLEIIGYTQEDVESYIKKYFSSHEDQSLADKMTQKLNGDRRLKELTANPLNTALLCLLCEETRGEFPSKRTKMYDDLVACALRRYFAKRGISLGDDDPMERCASELNQLGKMAFEALLKNQLYFTQDEMKSPPTVDFLRLPFLSREPSVSKIRPTPTYAFTHKTFQEYFAAFYLAQQLLSGDKDKERLLDKLSPIDNWPVWEFLITLVLSKSVETAPTVVSRLCAFFCHKRHQSLMDQSDSDVDLHHEILEDNPYDWDKYITKMSKDEQTRCRVLIKALDFIIECGDGDNELNDYQKKMVHVLARCFPLKKLELTLRSDFRTRCSVFSEYLRFNYSLTDLILHSAFDPLLLKTIEHVFHSKRNLVHFKLLNSAWARDAFLGFMVAAPEREKAFSNLGKRLQWNQSVGTKALLTEVLQSGRVLTHLNLDRIWICDGGTQVLADFLQINQALTHLNLRHAMISDYGATALAKALQLNYTLTHLSLPENWISLDGACALAASLLSNSELMYLDLSQNLGGDSVAVVLSKALESNCALKHLNLSQWFDCTEKNTPFPDSANVHVEMIGPEGGSALAKALRFNCTLTYLDLQYNNIGNTGAAALGEVLRTNTTLKELYLKDNKIGETGSEALGKGLQSNRTLTHLNLNFNHCISDSGAAAIAKALQIRGTKLTQLDLGFNKISSSGATSISEALCVNTSLTHLGLESNKINSSGAATIAKSLQPNRTLIHLDLRSNEIDDSGAKEFAHALRNHNNSLGFLDLADNYSISSVGIESLEQVDQSKCIVKL